MSEQYDDMQGTAMDVKDHPTHNFSDRVQLAGDVVSLPINPFHGSDRESSRSTAAEYSIGAKRGSDENVRSIGDATVNKYISNGQKYGRTKND